MLEIIYREMIAVYYFIFQQQVAVSNLLNFLIFFIVKPGLFEAQFLMLM